MGQLAAAIDKATARKGPLCKLAALRPQLSKGDVADLDGALADHGIPGTAIAAGLRELGHHVGDTTVNRHRRGLCGCAR